MLEVALEPVTTSLAQVEHTTITLAAVVKQFPSVIGKCLNELFTFKICNNIYGFEVLQKAAKKSR